MSESPDLRELRGPLDRLRAVGVVPRAAPELYNDSARIHNILRMGIYLQVAAYSDSGNPDVLPGLEEHITDHLTEIYRLVDGGKPGELGFVTDYARRKAEEKFPLDACHQAYRHIGKEVLDWVRKAALDVADKSAHVPRVVADVTDFVMEYMGLASTLLTSVYVEQTRVIAEAESDRRTELLSILLEGYDEADARAARLLRRAGYLQQRQSYCVVVAQSVKPEEMENTARAHRMIDAIAAELGQSPLRFISGVRDNQVVFILSGARRLSGWTRPHTALAERALPRLRLVGPAALMGVSNDVPSTSHIPRALSEARLALDFANVANRIVHSADIPFRQMLLTNSKGQLQGALPVWLSDFSAADDKSNGQLLATLRAYADADMNVLKTAKALGIHPNTVYARMQKIRDVSGQDPLSFHGLNELLLAADARQ